MTYLKRGMNREYYSVAFKRFRNDMLKDHLEVILTAVVILAVGIILFVRIRNRRKGGEQE